MPRKIERDRELREKDGDTENDHCHGTDENNDAWIQTSIFHIYDDAANITSLRD